MGKHRKDASEHLEKWESIAEMLLNTFQRVEGNCAGAPKKGDTKMTEMTEPSKAKTQRGGTKNSKIKFR